jgi:hypothetical protein
MSMKRLKQHRLSLMIGLLIVSAAILAGKMLDGTPIKQQLPFKNVQGTPPPKSMTIQLLRNPNATGNVVLTAEYDPELVEGAREFSIFIDVPNSATKKQVLLRDDGRDGDPVAGDSKFTASLQENLKVFKGKMLLAERELKASGGKLVVFEGRSGQVKQKDRLFDMAAFERFEPVQIDADILGVPLNKLGNKAGATARSDEDIAASASMLMEAPDLTGGGEIISDPGGGGEVVLPPPCDPVIDRTKSLFVTDISVTEDPVRTYNPCTNVGNPNGAWTFKTVMTNMANQPLTGVTPDKFVMEWLDTWMRGTPRLTPGTLNPVVNTQVLDSRVHPITPLTTQATTIMHAVIKPWLRAASGNPALVIDSLPSSPNYWKTIWQWVVDKYGDVLKFAPFKLTAIVNRVDLISSSTSGGGGYGGGGPITTITNGGEGRLVYSIIKDPRTACNGPVSSLTQPFEGFNVIMEYGIPITDCETLLKYQTMWRDLSDIPFGSSFNDALEKVTDVFTAMNAAPGKQNGSALNQLRSNEIAITSLLGSALPTPYAPGSAGNAPFWQLREFVLKGSPLLANTTTKLEAMTKFNGASFTPLTSGNSLADIAILASFVNTNAAAIKTMNFTVPDVFSGVNFQAGRADIHSPSATSTPHHWDGRLPVGSSTFINDDSARFAYSLNTCSGCHGGETGTPFVHVRYIGFGHNISHTSTSPPFGLRDLSSFLTGLGADAIGTDNDNDPNGFFFVKDAAGRPTGAPRIRGFNDLMRREVAMENFLCTGCGSGGAIITAVATASFARSSGTVMTH